MSPPPVLVFITSVSLIISLISFILYLMGKQMISRMTIVQVMEDNGFPLERDDGTFLHKGTFMVGSETYDFMKRTSTDTITLYCQNGYSNYNNGANCDTSGNYLQRNVTLNLDIARYTFGVFCISALLYWWFTDTKSESKITVKQNTQQRKSQQNKTISSSPPQTVKKTQIT